MARGSRSARLLGPRRTRRSSHGGRIDVHCWKQHVVARDRCAHREDHRGERSIVVTYRDIPITGQRVDFIVANEVILEIKAVTRMDPFFQAKLMSYLRTTGLRVGLLLNFNELLLKNAIKRVVM